MASGDRPCPRLLRDAGPQDSATADACGAARTLCHVALSPDPSHPLTVGCGLALRHRAPRAVDGHRGTARHSARTPGLGPDVGASVVVFTC